MKLLFDFFPIILFFVSYKIFGLYIATAVAIIASLIQIIIYRVKYQKYDLIQLVSSGIIIVLGAATLFFHNPLFIKWKPTGIFWLSSLAFLGTQFIGQKPLVQKMMEANITLPSKIWYRLNSLWVLFFATMGALNLYVAYNYDTDVWVNFKLFGGVGATLVFVIAQAFYLGKHLDQVRQ